jgi:hypothetical protein
MKRLWGTLLFALVASVANAQQNAQVWITCPTLAEAEAVVDRFRETAERGESYAAYYEKLRIILGNGACRIVPPNEPLTNLNSTRYPHEWTAQLKGGKRKDFAVVRKVLSQAK